MINIFYSENLINYTSGVDEEDKRFLKILDELSKESDKASDTSKQITKEIYHILLKKFLKEKDNYDMLVLDANNRLAEFKQECRNDYILKNSSLLNSLKNRIYRLQDEIDKLTKEFYIRKKGFVEITRRLKQIIGNTNTTNTNTIINSNIILTDNSECTTQPKSTKQPKNKFFATTTPLSTPCNLSPNNITNNPIVKKESSNAIENPFLTNIIGKY